MSNFEKSYVNKIGKIKYIYDKKHKQHFGHLTGAGRGCLFNLDITILILIRDLLKKFVQHMNGCPADYIYNAEGQAIRTVDEGCSLWSQEILSIANKCDRCIQIDEGVYEETFGEAQKEKDSLLAEVLDWLKNNLYSLWI